MDETTRLMIVADVFEEGSGVPASLQRLGAQVVVEPLPAGDYRISGGALVERKTVADLHGSLARGRLWSQIGRIRDAAALPFLFVEGPNLDDGPRHPNAIRGCMLAIADLGIAVVRTRDPDDTALWLKVTNAGATPTIIPKDADMQAFYGSDGGGLRERHLIEIRA